MPFIAFTNNEASSLRIYDKSDTVSIISEQPSYVELVYNAIKRRYENKNLGYPSSLL